MKIEEAFGSDRVVVRWVTALIQASGKSITITGMTMARVANGRIVEGWDSWDQLTMLQELGIVQFVSSKIIHDARAS